MPVKSTTLATRTFSPPPPRHAVQLTSLDLGFGPPGIAVPIHRQHVIRKRLAKDEFRGRQRGLGGGAVCNLDERGL